MKTLGLLSLVLFGCAAKGVAERAADDFDLKAPIYQFTIKDIDGQDVPFEKLKGKVLLVVNVASR